MMRLAVLACILCSASVSAHTRSESFSEWTWSGSHVSFTFSVLTREATRIPSGQQLGLSLGSMLEGHLAEHLSVSVDEQQCDVSQAPTVLRSTEGFLHLEGSFDCPETGTPTIAVNSFFDLVATHTHFSRARFGGRVEEFVLTQDQRTRSFAVASEGDESSLGGTQAFARYLMVGMQHILSGVDHLAFLLGLILLARGWKEMAWLITGFTIGHSISLAIAVLGVAQPNATMVEAMIGFTITLVAIEAAGLRYRQLRSASSWLFVLCSVALLSAWWSGLRWDLLVGIAGAGVFAHSYLRLVAQIEYRAALRLLVTATFGVIHGFGFAGGLLELEFPVAQLAFVLLGFNLGVELGQLVVLLLVIATVRLLANAATLHWRRRAANATVTTLSALGTFWFVSRLIP